MWPMAGLLHSHPSGSALKRWANWPLDYHQMQTPGGMSFSSPQQTAYRSGAWVSLGMTTATGPWLPGGQRWEKFSSCISLQRERQCHDGSVMCAAGMPGRRRGLVDFPYLCHPASISLQLWITPFLCPRLSSALVYIFEDRN